MRKEARETDISAKNGLDDRDRLLLKALQREGRATNAALAQLANLSESACLRRVRLLEERGVIERYAAVLNQKAVGLPISLFATITLASQSEAALAGFEKAIAHVPEVIECYLMTGTADYLVRIVASDVEDLERIHAQRLTRLPGVARITSSVALRTVVKRAELPID